MGAGAVHGHRTDGSQQLVAVEVLASGGSRPSRSSRPSHPSQGSNASSGAGRCISFTSWLVHAAYVVLHVYFISTVISMGLSLPAKAIHIPQTDGPSILLNQELISVVKVWTTLLTAPFVVYQTVKHWLSGTYFPMTAADSFYAMRTCRKIDKNPPEIRVGTVFCMVWLGFFFFVLSILSVLSLGTTYCPWGSASQHIDQLNQDCIKRYQELSEFTKVWVQIQIASGVVCLLLRLRRFILAEIFLLLVLVGGCLFIALTMGAGIFVLLGCCCKGIRRDSSLFCIPCSRIYGFFAFFYRIL